MHAFKRLLFDCAKQHVQRNATASRWPYLYRAPCNKQQPQFTVTKFICACLSSETGATDRPGKKTSRSKDSAKKNVKDGQIADLQAHMKSNNSKNRHSYVFRDDLAGM